MAITRGKRRASPSADQPSPSDDQPSPKKQAVSKKRSKQNDSESESGSISTRSSSRKASPSSTSKASPSTLPVKSTIESLPDPDEIPSQFVGDPIPSALARVKWPHRYEPKRNGDDEALRALFHYTHALVDGVMLSLYDDVFVQGEEGKPNYIGRIFEFFQGVDKELYFQARWFYRAEDTVIKSSANLIHEKRVFYSNVRDDNPLDCIVSKITIVQCPPDMDKEARDVLLLKSDFFCDMTYSVPFSTIGNLPPGFGREAEELLSKASEIASSSDVGGTDPGLEKHFQSKKRMTLLDLYAGCGAMSTGLCLGADLAGVNLVTEWAIDINRHACDSLRNNHPETRVWNVNAEDFLHFLNEWKELCRIHVFSGTENPQPQDSTSEMEDDKENDDSELSSEEFEVDHIMEFCYGDPKKLDRRGLYYKVHWKGYGPEWDSWEPPEVLSNCTESIKDFVVDGFKKRILPLPGDVDVLCGGPPCQGISGFNRHRNKNKPLEDPKNFQVVVFMDFVEFLRPKYVLMENVVDLLKFSEGFLGRYALSRLVAMSYQTRIGILAAGRYGLPQYRMRVFMWGACHTKKLPQYPLPTHDVVVRGGPPVEFELNVVYPGNESVPLEKALCLADAISDLPPVENNETIEEIPYGTEPQTDFQRNIRLRKNDLAASSSTKGKEPMLYDHLPYQCNEDDYQRLCLIPKKKGANFRDLPGVIVGENNIVEWDPQVPRRYLPSGKPLIPEYAVKFVKGRSRKPFGRVWWDSTVPTVVTRPQPHNQTILHPEQDRVLSVRENARLQGFPDYYKLSGPVKQKYIQVGNAVAVPVARALGYTLGLASQGIISDEPVLQLPQNFLFGN